MDNKSISQIKNELQAADESLLPFLIDELNEDARIGVRKLVAQAIARIKKLEKERERMEAMKKYEYQYAEYSAICGIDEAGRGPLAGPVVAGAVILPKDKEILYLNDSKKLSASKREELYEVIMQEAVAAEVGIIGPQEIDRVNILQATYLAMRQAVQKLKVKPDILLNDAVTIPQLAVRQVPIVKGDAKSASIAAASIIAKVTRDRLMLEYDKILPQYGFASNKGYGSAEHIRALKEYGPSVIHRRSFIGHFVDATKDFA